MAGEPLREIRQRRERPWQVDRIVDRARTVPDVLSGLICSQWIARREGAVLRARPAHTRGTIGPLTTCLPRGLRRTGRLTAARRPMASMKFMDLTEDLRLARQGDRPAAERLTPMVYDELKRLAAAYLRGEARGHTLQATALVHEAYMRLVDQTRAQFRDREHFIAVAATAMRRILVDHARRRAVAKRASAEQAQHADDPAAAAPDFVAIDESLTRLADRNERQARVVELRYFAGLSIAEVAVVLDVSERTIKSDWQAACEYLRQDWNRAHHPA